MTFDSVRVTYMTYVIRSIVLDSKVNLISRTTYTEFLRDRFDIYPMYQDNEGHLCNTLEEYYKILERFTKCVTLHYSIK